MTKAKRKGRRGAGNVVLTRDDGTTIELTAYEARAAYRELYSKTPNKKRDAEAQDETEIDRSMASAGVPV